MRTPSPDKRERESSSSIEMTPSPGSTTTESTTSQPSHTGSTTDGSIIHSSPTSNVSSTGSTVVESTPSESTDNEASDSQYSESESESTMTEERGRTDAQWWELREQWILHRYEKKTEFTCHQCNKKKTDILVAMKPEKNWNNVCCNACFCMKIGQDSDEWNLVHVDGVDHIW